MDQPQKFRLIPASQQLIPAVLSPTTLSTEG